MAKISEVRAVAELLSAEHESVEGLAEAVIELLDGLRAKQKPYAAVVWNPTLDICQVYAPFSTEKQVRKFAEKKITRYDLRTQGFLARVINPDVPE